MATYTVTTSFSANTTAIASEVNQNFTDVLTALNALDAANLTGTIALARISNLTSSQMAAAFFKDEDDMASDSATAVASQQSVKAHVTASSTDGYTPTSYAGEESMTYPNGFIMKQGLKTLDGNTTTVTFAAAFPTACTRVMLTGTDTSGDPENNANAHTLAAATFKVYRAAGSGLTVHWLAIGY